MPPSNVGPGDAPDTMSDPYYRQKLNYRGFASRIYLPDDEELEALGPLMPYAFVLFDSATLPGAGGVVGAQQTARGYTSQPDGCYITHLVSDNSEGPFVVQVYDTLRKQLWMPQPIQFDNFSGGNDTLVSFGKSAVGQVPFYLKQLYHLPPNAQLQCRVTNLAPVANRIQIVAWGLRP